MGQHQPAPSRGRRDFPGQGLPVTGNQKQRGQNSKRNTCPDAYKHPVPARMPNRALGADQPFSLTLHKKREGSGCRSDQRMRSLQTTTRQEETEVWCLRVITWINDPPLSGACPGSQLLATADLW